MKLINSKNQTCSLSNKRAWPTPGHALAYAHFAMDLGMKDWLREKEQDPEFVKGLPIYTNVRGRLALGDWEVCSVPCPECGSDSEYIGGEFLLCDDCAEAKMSQPDGCDYPHHDPR